jgi:peptide/nickel transport system ATP-binding protein
LSGRPDNRPLLRVENLSKLYKHANATGRKAEVAALGGVSFSIFPRTTVALVGESGSGKTSLAWCIASLEKPTSGNIWFEEQEITSLKEKELHAVRPLIQMVFQDPANSLNSRWTALEIVNEPLLIQRRFDKHEQRDKAIALLDRVGIPAEKAHQRPDEFSGGQRQRLAIARALALQPKLLVLDEALSALDCSVQAQIANLLCDLQASLGLTYLFITHDLAMAAHLADQIVVMDHGEIVERGACEDVLGAPQHAVTRRLVAAATGWQDPPAKLRVV